MRTSHIDEAWRLQPFWPMIFRQTYDLLVTSQISRVAVSGLVAPVTHTATSLFIHQLEATKRTATNKNKCLDALYISLPVHAECHCEISGTNTDGRRHMITSNTLKISLLLHEHILVETTYESWCPIWNVQHTIIRLWIPRFFRCEEAWTVISYSHTKYRQSITQPLSRPYTCRLSLCL